MRIAHALLGGAGLILSSAAAGYALANLIAILIWRRIKIPAVSLHRLPVTVLKPVCDLEPGLYEHLRSFCLQDYPVFQLIFGVRDAADPALAVIRRLVIEFPNLQIDVVVDPLQHGENRKVSNLINMMVHARHDLLVLADSDTFVGSDYLGIVTAPLENHKVGLVSCIYYDMPTPRLWSRLGAMYINDWYMPSVVLARLCGFGSYASGQTLALRRDSLNAIGGLRMIADHLADDYRLGELVRGLGLSIVLSRYPVRAQHDEPNFASLMRHEVRWMQTIRVLRPHSFRFLFATFSFPLAACGIVLAAVEPRILALAGLLLCITVVARSLVHIMQRSGIEGVLFVDLWLVPAFDLLLCWVWLRCFFTSRVTWRGNEFHVGSDGVMRSLS